MRSSRSLIAVALAGLSLAANLVCGVDLRIALAAGGLALACLAGRPGLCFGAFRNTLRNPTIIGVVLPVLGYTQIVRDINCHADLLALLAGPIEAVGVLAVPLVVVASFVMSKSLVSANASAAAVGVVAIPYLVRMGVPGPMAGAAVLAGTWGAVSSIASTHAANIAKEARTDSGTVVLKHLPAAAFGLLLVVGLLFAEAWALGEVGQAPNAPRRADAVEGVASPFRAALPILPLAFLLLQPVVIRLAGSCLHLAGRDGWANGLRRVRLHHCVVPAMVLASVWAVLATGMGPGAAAAAFFRGLFRGFLDVVGLIVGGVMLIEGLDANGVIGKLRGALRGRHRSVVPACSMMSTFATAALTGSGDAVVAGVVNAFVGKGDELGTEPLTLGSLAWIGGEMGRCLSPFAAVTATVAGLASLTPWPLIERCALPILVGAVSCFLVLVVPPRAVVRGGLARLGRLLARKARA